MIVIRICTVVTGNSVQKLIAHISTAKQEAEYIEVRADYAEDISPESVELIRKASGENTIFTCRSPREGGKFVGDEVKRIKILKTAIDAGFWHVDIEFETLKQAAFDKLDSVIVSWHNFKETPPYWAITKQIFDMKQIGAGVVKVATLVQKPYDVQVLYRALLSKKPEENQIIIGMGNEGKETRLLGPILGSYLTYAATKQSETAPGQIDIDVMKAFYRNFYSTCKEPSLRGGPTKQSL